MNLIDKLEKKKILNIQKYALQILKFGIFIFQNKYVSNHFLPIYFPNKYICKCIKLRVLLMRNI